MEIHAVPGGTEVVVIDRTLSSQWPVLCAAPPTPLVTSDWVYDFAADPVALTANCRWLDVDVPGVILGMESAASWLYLQGPTLLRQTETDEGVPLLPASAREVRWVVMSPDGASLAFTAVDPAGELTLWRVDLATDTPTRVELPAELVGADLTLNDWVQ